MKAKFAILLVAAMTSRVALADQSKSIVLQDGTAAVVSAQSGTLTTYVKSAVVGADGKVVLTLGEVFDGTRLAKSADGRCVKVVDRLVRLNDVATAGVKIQLPVMQHTEESVTCGS